jgi:putative transposase
MFGQAALHRAVYYQARAQFPHLGAQATVRAIARVAAAYANRGSTRKRAHIFRPYGAVPFDARMISFNRDARTISIWTPGGRAAVAYTGRDEDLKAVEELPVGECDLICRNGTWLLQVAVTVPKPEITNPVNGFLGVDQGVANLVVTSDGHVLPGRVLPGLAGHADLIAAINIARRGVDGWGAVNRPHATGLPSPRRDLASKPRAAVRCR